MPFTYFIINTILIYKKIIRIISDLITPKSFSNVLQQKNLFEQYEKHNTVHNIDIKFLKKSSKKQKNIKNI